MIGETYKTDKMGAEVLMSAHVNVELSEEQALCHHFFGSMLVFVHHQYGATSNFDKPLLKNMKEFFRIVDWNMFE